MTTPYVEYGYSNGSSNTVRPTDVTYPDGRELSLDYGSGGSMSDALSRVGSILDDDNTHLADYAYLGERSFVTGDLAQPDVKWTLASLTGTNDPDTGDIYSGLDRFGRVKDNRWYDYGASADADRIKYGYDRAGNRTWRQNTVADAQGKHFDELYGNDLIHRLKELARGTLNANKNGVTDKSFAECWSLDPTGNWKKFLEDTNGDGTWNLDQARTANPVNEITGITESAGPSWATPAYSSAGNMTTVPQPSDPTKTYTATYDAWNRLVKLVDDDSDDTVAEYQYDGANRRIVQKSYESGDLAETRHLYYTQPSQWQVVEERVDAETDPDRQFVWGLRYIDDLILRDRDTNGNGSLDERLYGLQDANWNLTALTDTAGDVQERCVYSAYGTPLFLTPSFGGRVSSSFDWETLYAGYRWETLTELFHVRHRLLNSALGTWCQRDPLGMVTTWQLYEYVVSGPMRLVDPSGRFQEPGWYPALPPSAPLSERVIPCPCTSSAAADLNKRPGTKSVIDDPWAVSNYHPGADHCYRVFNASSDIEFGVAGNQCCYDAAGQLITDGPGAGTPDYVSTYADTLLPVPQHICSDVWQYHVLGWKTYHAAGWAPVNDPSCPENRGGPAADFADSWHGVIPGPTPEVYQHRPLPFPLYLPNGDLIDEPYQALYPYQPKTTPIVIMPQAGEYIGPTTNDGRRIMYH